MKYARLKVCDQELQIKEIGMVEFSDNLPEFLSNIAKKSIYSLKCLKMDNQIRFFPFFAKCKSRRSSVQDSLHFRKDFINSHVKHFSSEILTILNSLIALFLMNVLLLKN